MRELLSVYTKLNKVFEANGFSLYMVGGTSRDFLLGYEVFDFDFTTDATPEEMKEFLGIEESKFKSGSVTIKFEGEKVDITTLREEGKYNDYRHPDEVIFVKDLRKDYIRRDFTINALYINSESEIVDYVGGQKDLKNKIIRMIGNPQLRLEEDPLRILRALRFAISLDFSIDEELEVAIKEKKNLLAKLNYVKCLEEMDKMKKVSLVKATKILKEYKIDEVLPIEYNYSSKRLNAIDMHCDTITNLNWKHMPLLKNNNHIDLMKLIKGEYMLQCFAIFIHLSEGNPFNRFCDNLKWFKNQMELNKNLIQQVTTYNEVMTNKSQKRLSALLTVEEGGIIEGSLEKLDYLYEQGVRMMTLTWNFPNEIGYPNIKFTKEGVDLYSPNVKDGLTPFGIKVVQRMNELGMIIDVSHLSDAGFYDVIKYSKDPIVASHSNARSIQSVVRNLTDDMILKLKENGGVMGINYCSIFVSDSKEDQIEDIVKHIEHIVKIGGIGVVALGSDFDGIDTPIGMEDATCTLKLKQALLQHGFTAKDLDKLFHDNFLRVFKKVCSKKGV